MARRRPTVSSQSLRVTGFDELDRVLDLLDKRVARKVTRSAMGAMMTVVRKRVRSEIKAASLSPRMKRALSRLVGSRFAKSKTADEASAKVGFAVGMKAKSKRAAGKRSGQSRSGVGISAANVHWFALGTKDRYTTRGRYSGRIEAVRVIRRAALAARAEAREAAVSKGKAVLDLELGREIRLR